MEPKEIRVTEMKVIENKGPLKAYAAVRLDDWVTYDWRIVQQNGQRAWVSPPQATWKGPDGRVRYRSLLSIPGELKQKVEVAILSAWELEKRNAARSA